ncbi:unnamed protein product [Mytilus edulis]|uniref:Uncharacterized protein n=1 Tax=Mytilus edulis TaxID=6550 RepID=A0A8S3S2Z7_MYTED|nr:unnamed protein product [Mytilus edulis]
MPSKGKRQSNCIISIKFNIEVFYGIQGHSVIVHWRTQVFKLMEHFKLAILVITVFIGLTHGPVNVSCFDGGEDVEVIVVEDDGGGFGGGGGLGGGGGGGGGGMMGGLGGALGALLALPLLFAALSAAQAPAAAAAAAPAPAAAAAAAPAQIVVQVPVLVTTPTPAPPGGR